jgi:hypothetical protein
VGVASKAPSCVNGTAFDEMEGTEWVCQGRRVRRSASDTVKS